MNESIKALSCGAVKIEPAKIPWKLTGGKSCEAHLLSGTVQTLQYPIGLDTLINLAIALPFTQSHITFRLYHILVSSTSSWADITITEKRESSDFDFDYDIHRKNIEAILRVLKIPLEHACLDPEENHTNDDDFGFSWKLIPLEP